MIKKLIFGAFAALAIPAMVAYAATPMFSVSGAGSGNVNVNISGGEINSPVTLYYNSAAVGTIQGYTIGTTNASGTFSGTFNTDVIGVNWNTPVYVQVGGYQSNSVMWPYNATAATNGNNSWNASSTNNNAITFSQSSPTVSLGQNGSITLYGGSGNYYVASNSNTSGVTPTISGNTLNLYGAATGNASIVVCSTGGGCGTLYTTIQGSNQSGSPLLSTSNLNFNLGSQGMVTLSGGSAPYMISVPSGSGISTTLMGNTLYVNGTATGTAMLTVCSQNGTTANGGCTPLTVNVSSQATSSTGNNGNTSTGGQMSFTLPLTLGQALSLNLSGGVGGYYLQSPMSSPALASVNGNTLILNGSAIGNGTVTVCQTGGSACLPISFSVSPSTSTNTGTGSGTSFGTGGGYFFDYDLSIGMSGQDVRELQQRLKEEGYFDGEPTGYFGHVTAASVIKWQKAHGINSTGYVGALTRAELNK